MGLPALSRVFWRPLSGRNILEVESWLWVLTRIQHNTSIQQPSHLELGIDLQKDEDNSLNFENHELAFGYKSSWEVSRALGILLLCGSDKFVDNSEKLMAFSQRVLGKRLFRAAMKPTFYKQFIGGESHEEIINCIKKMKANGIQPIVGSTMEDDSGARKDEVYDSNCGRIIECIRISSNANNDVPMAQFKITGLLPAGMLINMSKIFTATKFKEQLIEEIASGLIGKTKLKAFEKEFQLADQDRLQKGIRRLKDIAQEAKRRSVRLLVDAEHNYLNPGISLFALSMMLAINDSLPLVWNTYQCYRKDAMKNLKLEMELTDKFGVTFGAKIVRGAYMAQEALYAIENNLPNPICDSYEATNKNYNSILNYMLEHISTAGEKYNIIVASHNEESIKLAVQRMKQLNIKPKGEGVHFGQLYGMCDQVTYPLASMGYSVYKSIPYGSVEELLPYFARRAMENKSVLAGSRKEKQMLWENLKLRMSTLCRVNRLRKGSLQAS